ncbi:hypothetical protein M1L60_39980 [Actinoplanes sp. TRM 88003]|uniref:Uncharacterized protein n=1 Tax=Paractinoplanes aksuensis TaxID=2939490 RepID=A0ABT1E100_9ACTN|nr:hypothetical protein [Actinoplanes aksuensis]MCO8276777.1 hypothetical protein [Actinoplanes aksuensis]
MTGWGAWPREEAAGKYGPLLGVLLVAPARGDPRPLLQIIDRLEAEGNALGLEVVADGISAEAHDEFLDTDALTVLVQLAVQVYGRASAIASPDRQLFLAAKGLGMSSLLHDDVTSLGEDLAGGMSEALGTTDPAWLVDAAKEARHHNLPLTVAMLHALRDTSPEAAEVLVFFQEDLIALYDRLGLPRAAFETAVLATYAAAYSQRDSETSVRLARAALRRGDTLPDSIELRDRLYSLSRQTLDADEVARRFERIAVRLRDEQNWSGLAYRYFVVAEYTGVERHYQLAVYYFEKAAALGAREEYRQLECRGFALGASARLNPSAETFDQAAAILDRAARLTFQNERLFLFYSSTGHFFAAHAHLVRGDAAGAATAFDQCFDIMRQAFRPYAEVLRRMAAGAAEPCPPDQVAELRRTMHPRPEQLAAAAAAGDLTAVGAGCLYLNPLL